MRYHYALDESGKLVEVQALEPGAAGRFVCPGCGEPLIARLGSVKQWHFAHKPGSQCRPETYLHRLGKQVFYETYRHCLQSGSPYIIGLYQGTCQRPFADLPGLAGHRCGAMAPQRYDLCRYFPQIELERPESCFVPDLLLRDRKGAPGLYVEIRVSHGCSAAKLASGRRILEIRLQSEADLALIWRGPREQRSFSLKGQQIEYDAASPVRLYNFGRQARSQQSCDCQQQSAFVFRICKYSGRPLQSLMPLPEAAVYYARAGQRFSWFACAPSEGLPAFCSRARRFYRSQIEAARAAGISLQEPA